jgi:zinc transport system substrate-binding protein
MARQNFQTTLQRTVWVAAGRSPSVWAVVPRPPPPVRPSLPDAAASEDVLQVVTTFLPITQFTNAVAGDRAEVVQLLPTNVGPHEYQAKPGDVQAIANADVLVQNGLEMEFFLDDMIDNAGNAELVIIDSSEGHWTSLASADDHGHDHGKTTMTIMTTAESRRMTTITTMPRACP